MFVRIKKISNTNKSKIQLVQTFRRSGKVVQKVIRHIGTAHNDIELAKLKEFAEVVKEQEIEKLHPRIFSAEELDKLKIKNNDPINVNLKQLKEEEIISQKKNIAALSLYWTFLLIVWLLFFLTMYIFNDTVIAWCKSLLS